MTETRKIWQPLAQQLVIPHDEASYQKLVAWLDSLIDEVGENEQHPLASLMDIIGVLIEYYENEHIPICGVSHLNANCCMTCLNRTFG